MAPSSVTLTVRVTPRADRNALTGVRADGVLLARVCAAPVEGGANRAVQALLADALGVRKTAIALQAGAGAREKRFRIEGLTAAEYAARIESLPRIGGGSDPENA